MMKNVLLMYSTVQCILVFFEIIYFDFENMFSLLRFLTKYILSFFKNIF